jgi:putative thioredoxin
MSFEVQNFQEDVIVSSHKTPVLVDFWAPWCGPCRVLGPVLEKLAAESGTKWKLVKVDTDQNPDLSAQFGIRGIPAVKLFVQGKVRDEFTGALPEHAIRKWLEDAIPSEKKALLQQAEQQISDGNTAAAVAILESILVTDPADPQASGLLAQLIVFADSDRAAALAEIASADPRFTFIMESIKRLDDARHLPESDSSIGSETGGDHYLAASRAIKKGDLDTAIQSLIEVLKVNRYLDDDGARKTGVALFTLLGDGHPLARKYRRTFDMWLY